MGHDYERLGAFYLGRRLAEPREHVVLPASDFTTHAVCVGMTGSGKTGLCLALLEEAAIDGIPVIAIDPKGDLANLALAFPSPSAQDLLPFVDRDAASRAGQSIEDFAAAEAARWREGLTASDQDVDRASLLRQAADVLVFTPGSEAGVPLAMLRSLDAPDARTRASAEAMRDRTTSTITAILTLAGLEVDPVASREHALLSAILQDAWGRGVSMDFAGLIGAVQAPPFRKIGVLDLESFYAAKDRFALVMALNSLLASPAASALMRGEAPEPSALWHGPTGRPRLAVVSLAHLGEGERRAFLTMFLGNVLSWMRGQPGTSSLRALLYMDEVAGYLPPVANPPTKPLFLTLFKQARAFGLGVVVATQNPVDVDYKVLSNAGTWFVGRLQTARDRARVVEGLSAAAEAAGGGAAVEVFDRAISSLASREFLHVSARGEAPYVFTSRFTLSYLRGPMSLAEIARLPKPGEATRRVESAPTLPGRPAFPPDVTQSWVPLAQPPDGTPIGYAPSVLGVARVRLTDKRTRVDETFPIVLAAQPDGSVVGVDWTKAYPLYIAPEALRATPEVDDARYQEFSRGTQTAAAFSRLARSFVEHLVRECTATVFLDALTGLSSSPRETERDFRIRLGDALRVARDAEVAARRAKLEPKYLRLEERLRKATQRLEKEQSDVSRAQRAEGASVSSGVLEALLGRRLFSGANVRRIERVSRAKERTAGQRDDAARASADLAAARRAYEELDREAREVLSEIAAKYDPSTVSLTSTVLSPKKSQIEVIAVGVGYLPYRAIAGAWVAGWG